MPRFQAPGGEIYFEQFGARVSPPVLLIAGIGNQLIHWPTSFVDGLVSRGLRIVVFDNRDSGLSYGCDVEPPSLETLLKARDDPESLTPAYTMADLARDAVRLLDHLGQAGAHLVGLSMGGIVAQHLAAKHANRTFSLTCINSTARLPDPSDEVIAALLGGVGADGDDAIVAGSIKGSKLLGGAFYDSEKYGHARVARLAFERAYRPDGFMRQLAAIIADGDRSPMLKTVRTPTLVIHGDADPLFSLDSAKDIAIAIAQAKFEAIEHVGHDLPEPVIPRYVDLIAAHIESIHVER
ncbi:MAG: alpha/beta fold hydrolase [Gammaproteobacteria bacterium]|nr:alpha/beta fold hydrolase [Gammaproteobacteria bacterium]